MKRLPAPLVQPPEGDDRTYITAALPPDMVERLEQVLDTVMRTHPDADMQGVVDMVMCAGIEAVERGPADAPVIGATGAALAAACAQRDTYRAALRKIAALRAGAGSAKLHNIINLARSALNE